MRNPTSTISFSFAAIIFGFLFSLHFGQEHISNIFLRILFIAVITYLCRLIMPWIAFSRLVWLCPLLIVAMFFVLMFFDGIIYRIGNPLIVTLGVWGTAALFKKYT